MQLNADRYARSILACIDTLLCANKSRNRNLELAQAPSLVAYDVNNRLCVVIAVMDISCTRVGSTEGGYKVKKRKIVYSAAKIRLFEKQRVLLLSLNPLYFSRVLT